MESVKLIGLVVVPAPTMACGVVVGMMAIDGTDKLHVFKGDGDGVIHVLLMFPKKAETCLGFNVYAPILIKGQSWLVNEDELVSGSRKMVISMAQLPVWLVVLLNLHSLVELLDGKMSAPFMPQIDEAFVLAPVELLMVLLLMRKPSIKPVVFVDLLKPKTQTRGAMPPGRFIEKEMG